MKGANSMLVREQCAACVCVQLMAQITSGGGAESWLSQLSSVKHGALSGVTLIEPEAFSEAEWNHQVAARHKTNITPSVTINIHRRSSSDI